MQTYFISPEKIDYLVVVDNKTKENLIISELSPPLKKVERNLFMKLDNDYQGVKGDMEKQASIVQNFGYSRSARVPWPERVAFPSHLVGLQDEEMKGRFAGKVVAEATRGEARA